MKTVFENSMVAHVWAQQNQPEGKSGNGNFYFIGATIYSYGRHFPVARFCIAKGGKKYALVTERHYSISTTRHVSYVRQSIPHNVPVFFVSDPGSENIRAQFEEAVRREVLAAVNVKSRAKSVADRIALRHIGAAIHLVQRANEFAAYTGERWRLREPEASPDYVEKARAAKTREDARVERKRQEQEALRLEQNRVVIAEWLAGKDQARFRLPRFDAECGGAALRIKGDELQTSHGASVPLAHAVRAFRFLKLCREHSRSWDRNGHSIRVGQFTIDSVAPDGSFRAACHDIRWPEIERVARQAGVIDETASDEALQPSHAAA